MRWFRTEKASVGRIYISSRLIRCHPASLPDSYLLAATFLSEATLTGLLRSTCTEFLCTSSSELGSPLSDSILPRWLFISRFSDATSALANVDWFNGRHCVQLGWELATVSCSCVRPRAPETLCMVVDRRNRPVSWLVAILEELERWVSGGGGRSRSRGLARDREFANLRSAGSS